MGVSSLQNKYSTRVQKQQRENEKITTDSAIIAALFYELCSN